MILGLFCVYAIMYFNNYLKRIYNLFNTVLNEGKLSQYFIKMCHFYQWGDNWGDKWGDKTILIKPIGFVLKHIKK